MEILLSDDEVRVLKMLYEKEYVKLGINQSHPTNEGFIFTLGGEIEPEIGKTHFEAAVSFLNIFGFVYTDCNGCLCITNEGIVKFRISSMRKYWDFSYSDSTD